MSKYKERNKEGREEDNKENLDNLCTENDFIYLSFYKIDLNCLHCSCIVTLHIQYYQNHQAPGYHIAGYGINHIGQSFAYQMKARTTISVCEPMGTCLRYIKNIVVF